MTNYLLSFPSEAMVLTADELPIVGAAASAVVDEAKAAGVYVFAGGIDEDVDRCSSRPTEPRAPRSTPARA